MQRITIDSLQLADQWSQLAVISSNGSGNIITRNITGLRKVTIFVGGLSPGMYFIRLTGKEEKASYLKFMKL